MDAAGQLARIDRYVKGLPPNDEAIKETFVDVALVFGSMLRMLERDGVANWILPIYQALQNPDEWMLSENGRIRHAHTGVVLGLARKARWWWPKKAMRVEILAPVKIESERLNWRVHWLLAPMCMSIQCQLLRDAFFGYKTFAGSGDGI